MHGSKRHRSDVIFCVYFGLGLQRFRVNAAQHKVFFIVYILKIQLATVGEEHIYVIRFLAFKVKFLKPYIIVAENTHALKVKYHIPYGANGHFPGQ